MLNEISPGIFNNKYLHYHEIDKEDFLLCYRDNQVLLKKSGDDYEIPRKKDFADSIESSVYLFSINSNRCFGLIEPQVNIASSEFYDVFILRNLKDKEFAWIVSVGHQLINWHHNNKYCGRCGSKTELKKDERAVVCSKCNLVVFPAIAPAIIVAITCNNKILLAKGANYKGDFYALIAGYVDVGESIEETVVREVKEEVGLDIKNLKYYKSQPWPYSASLMLGFTAEADDTREIVIDKKEIKEAGWFERGNLPPHASGVSISGDLIAAFEKGLF
ncbi:MAG: NAD(+) diphosphatase [Bacteroidetes bacterium HGW-Bacteroidetes-6]|nr:MAG: NAD(+) diphosphatase [Bacteroidetes bacterium HGW-Bacteroidetes-6]